MSTMGAVAIWGPMAPASSTESMAPGEARVASVVRLTRRGRLLRAVVLVGLLLALVAVGVARLTGAPARAGSEPTVPVTVGRVTVEQGDSLWLIAQRLAPQRDPRDVVHRVRELNGLSSNLIQPGQVLLVPSGL